MHKVGQIGKLLVSVPKNQLQILSNSEASALTVRMTYPFQQNVNPVALSRLFASSQLRLSPARLLWRDRRRKRRLCRRKLSTPSPSPRIFSEGWWSLSRSSPTLLLWMRNRGRIWRCWCPLQKGSCQSRMTHCSMTNWRQSQNPL